MGCAASTRVPNRPKRARSSRRTFRVHGVSDKISHGSAAEPNIRTEVEWGAASFPPSANRACYSSVPNILPGTSFFGVFEGHGSHSGAMQASENAAEELPALMRGEFANPQFKDEGVAISNAFAQFQKACTNTYDEEIKAPLMDIVSESDRSRVILPHEGGCSAAVVAFFNHSSELIVANVGKVSVVVVEDLSMHKSSQEAQSLNRSRKSSKRLVQATAVSPHNVLSISVDSDGPSADNWHDSADDGLWSGKLALHLQVSVVTDLHQLSNRSEVDRIRGCGANVTNLADRLRLHAVDGSLSVTRSLGDVAFHQSGAVSHQPYLASVQVTPATSLVLIASSQVWRIAQHPSVLAQAVTLYLKKRHYLVGNKSAILLSDCANTILRQLCERQGLSQMDSSMSLVILALRGAWGATAASSDASSR